MNLRDVQTGRLVLKEGDTVRFVAMHHDDHVVDARGGIVALSVTSDDHHWCCPNLRPVPTLVPWDNVVRIDVDEQDAAAPAELDLAYTAWTIIANVSGGDWSQQSDEWREAATRWRDRFNAVCDEAMVR